MRARTVAVAAALLAAGAFSSAVSAQDTQADLCAVSIGRGSTGMGEVIQPNVVAYTPNAGYTGPDEFHYGGSGPGREGRILPFSVQIQVRVIGPDAPLR